MSAREEGLRAAVEALIEEYQNDAANEPYGGESWNATEARLSRLLADHPATPGEVGTRNVEPEMMPTAGGWACKRCGDAPHDCGEPECYHPCPTTPGCVGDARYDSPDRRHVTGCQHEPVEPDAGDVGTCEVAEHE